MHFELIALISQSIQVTNSEKFQTLMDKAWNQKALQNRNKQADI